MDKFIQALKDKRLRYGAFSTLTAVFVIAILLVINLLAGQFNLSLDLTQNKMYSLSERTKSALSDIDQDIVIYSLLRTGMSDPYIEIIRELLEEYPSVNNRIRLEYKDPYLYPQFIEQYRSEGTEIPAGSVIVTGPEKFKVIPADELLTQEFDYQTWQSYVSGINLEPQVTNAILYVLGGEVQTLYILKGHGEQELAPALINRLSMANYETKELTALNTPIPEDCSVLFVTTPERDWSEQTASMVQEYLENDGRAVFFIDFTGSAFANMESVLSVYGVELIQGLVFEGDPNYYFQGSPINLIPAYSSHEITQSAVEKGYASIIPMSMAITESDIKMQSTTIYPLLITSNNSYVKTNLDSQSINKEPDDIGGPFIISAAVEDNSYTDAAHTTKLVVTASSSILNDTVNDYVMGANYDFVINSVNWTQDKADDLYISPKTSAQSILMMNAGEAFIMIGMSLAIPLVILIIGGVVWFRRRNS